MFKCGDSDAMTPGHLKSCEVYSVCKHDRKEQDETWHNNYSVFGKTKLNKI